MFVCFKMLSWKEKKGKKSVLGLFYRFKVENDDNFIPQKIKIINRILVTNFIK